MFSTLRKERESEIEWDREIEWGRKWENVVKKAWQELKVNSYKETRMTTFLRKKPEC